MKIPNYIIRVNSKEIESLHNLEAKQRSSLAALRNSNDLNQETKQQPSYPVRHKTREEFL